MTRKFLLFKVRKRTISVWNGEMESVYGYGGNYDERPKFVETEVGLTEEFIIQVNVTYSHENQDLLSEIDEWNCRTKQEWINCTNDHPIVTWMDNDDSQYKFVEKRKVTV